MYLKAINCLSVLMQSAVSTLLIWLVFPMQNFGQTPYYIEINHEKNLPSNTVYQVTQDSAGFIWLVCNKGLFKYDGFSYTAYRNELQNSVSGSDLKIDSYGRVWYQSFDGFLYYVDNKTNQLQQLTTIDLSGFLPTALSEKYLIKGSRLGISLIDLKTLKLTKKLAYSFNTITSVHVLEDKVFCLANDSLFIYNLNTFVLEQKTALTQKFGGHPQARLIKNELIFFSKFPKNNNLYKWSNNKLISLSENLNYDVINDIIGIDGDLWILTPKGIHKLDKQYERQQSFFKQKNISNIFKDSNGNFWVTTLTDGVFLIPELNSVFYPLEEYKLTDLQETKNAYFGASKNGVIYQFDKQFNLLNKLDYGNNLTTNYFFADWDEKYLIHASKGFVHYSLPNFTVDFTENFAVKDVAKISDELFVFAASGIVGFYSPKGKIKNQNIFPLPKDDLSNKKNINVIQNTDLRGRQVAYFPYDTTFVVATNLGVFKYVQSQFSPLFFDDYQPFASQIFNANNSLLYLGANGKVYFSEQKNGEFKEPVCLEVPFVIKIVKIKDNFWFLTESSLFRWSEKEPVSKIKNYPLTVEPSSIQTIISYKNNELTLLTNKGVVKFELASLEDKKVSLKLNQAILNNRIINPELKYYDEGPNQNLEISFSLLNFGVFTNHQVLYQINNNAPQKVDLNTRIIKFPNLAPSKYKFSLLMDLGNGQYQKLDAANFEILPPIWFRGWFILLILVLVALITYAFYKVRINGLIKQNEVLSQKVTLEKELRKSTLKAIKSQMNPHFFFNALNSIQSFIFDNDKKNASFYLAKFSKLTRLILEMSEKDFVTLAEEIEALELYLTLEKMRFNNDFEYKIKVDSNLDIDTVKICPMLIQPFIENAIKHGLFHKSGDKWVELRFNKEDNLLNVEIEDNGVGRLKSNKINAAKSSKYKSFSSQANLKRVNILSESETALSEVAFDDKLNASGESEGTLVRFCLPIL
jgi:ligand-binding sensor domain-containing protein